LLQLDEGRRCAQTLGNGEQLISGLATTAGDQLTNIVLVRCGGSLSALAGGAEVAQKIVRHKDHQQPVLARGPAENDILTEAPLPPERPLEALQVSSLYESDGFHGAVTPAAAGRLPTGRPSGTVLC